MGYPYVDTNDPLFWYQELVRYGLAEGTAPDVRERRESLAEVYLSDTQQQKLAILDEEALEYVMELPALDVDLVLDSQSAPLENWWWHLRKIRQGCYPTDLLPPHLREVYEELAGEGKQRASQQAADTSQPQQSPYYY